MISKIFIISLLCFTSIKSVSQTKGNNNLQGKLFVGAEFGNNTITSFEPNHINGLQAGIMVEYYFLSFVSISGRIKYFETGVRDKINNFNGFFKGAVLSIPVNLNGEFKIIKKLKGTVKVGLAANQEVKSNYTPYFSNKIDASKFYGTFNTGVGICYYLNNKTALYLNYEVFVLGNDRISDQGFKFLPKLPNSPNNNLLNIGIKHCFKK